jgi:hypothetical protein
MLNQEDIFHDISFDVICDLTMSPPSSPAHPPSTRFVSVTHEEIEKRIAASQPESTKKKMKWAVKMFMDWQQSQPSGSSRGACQELSQFEVSELSTILPKFLFEVRKKNGENYPSKTLYEVFAMINYYLVTEAKWKTSLFKDPSFDKARRALEAKMKENARAGLTSGGNKSLFISKPIEDGLWESGILGSDNPSTLLNTVIYLIGIHFALRGGEELRRLRHGDLAQIKSAVDSNGTRCLVYHEDVSKTRQGGIKSISIKPKQLYGYHNDVNHERCLVCLLKKYEDKRPPDVTTDALFLTPLKNGYSAAKWYKNMPLGKNMLANVVKTIMIGCEGRYTNQSLRRTAATRLFQEDVSDDLIRFQTGHRSSAVLEYKEPSSEQLKTMSANLYETVTSAEKEKSSVEPCTKCEPAIGNIVGKKEITERVAKCDSVNNGESNKEEVEMKEMESCEKSTLSTGNKRKYDYAPERTVIELEKNGAKLRIFM